MAKKTWTDFIAGDNDLESPYEDSLIETIQDNNFALKKTPFYLRWFKARVDGSDDKRDEWKTNATGGSYGTRGGWWPIWILPGMEVLHIELLATIEGSGSIGRVRMDLVIAGPNFAPDILHAKTSISVSLLTPTLTKVDFTWNKSELEDRWGKLARLRLQGTLTTRINSGHRLVVKEQPEAISYWGQAV